jgi:hypothetical protein
MQLLLLPLPMFEHLLLLRLKRATLLPRFHRQNRLMLRRQMTQRGLQQVLQLRVAPVRVLKLHQQRASARRCRSDVRRVVIGPVPILREPSLEDLFLFPHHDVVGRALRHSARRCLQQRLRQRCLRELFCTFSYLRRKRSMQGHVQR